ncbi:3-oxo-5-alpha-steroid 4-dehydrogenase-like protein [Calycina marina]|uniref:Polyprenal reductase n=1 Tax=Calycina marina TaxID=1763456 RepID=A0A9P8CIE6_9HELO|nr:3-oxo-5-alpha-steroid 4-dehydrogenase-like protein [Calycina marina]
MGPATLCIAFFTLGAAVDIGGTLSPTFRTKIMNYGSRNETSSPAAAQERPTSMFGKLFDTVASMQVPHSWFIHYYIVSGISSLFWGYQIFTGGKVFQFLVSYTDQSTSGMTFNQVVLAWTFMTTQGTRRLYECVTLTKPSQSRMWIGLWAIGMLYYVFMGISVWIEGTAALNHQGHSLEISWPSMRSSIATVIFAVASLSQHGCHVYLASLKKYTLPDRGLFGLVVCPHYTCECLVYIAIAVVAAPKDRVLNTTVLSGLGFVVTNLAVTADSTLEWYAEKFGADKVRGRKRMVPFLF